MTKIKGKTHSFSELAYPVDETDPLFFYAISSTEGEYIMSDKYCVGNAHMDKKTCTKFVLTHQGTNCQEEFYLQDIQTTAYPGELTMIVATEQNSQFVNGILTLNYDTWLNEFKTLIKELNWKRLQYYPEDAYVELSVNDRIEALIELLSSSFITSGNIWSVNEERIITNLFSIEAQDQSLFYNSLVAEKNREGVYLLDALANKVSHDSFTRIAADILRWYNNSAIEESIQASTPVIDWFDKDHDVWQRKRTFEFNSSGNINFRIKTSWFTEESSIESIISTYEDLSPLSPVVVNIKLLSNTASHSKNVIVGMQEGDTYVLPAIVFVWMINQHDKLENLEMLKESIKVASLFVSVKELGTASNIIARVLSTGTVISDMGDMFFTDDRIKEKLSNLDSGAEVLFVWNEITKHFSRTSFTYSTLKGKPELFVTFKITWNELISSNIDVKIVLGEEDFKKINDFCDLKIEE